MNDAMTKRRTGWILATALTLLVDVAVAQPSKPKDPPEAPPAATQQAPAQQAPVQPSPDPDPDGARADKLAVEGVAAADAGNWLQAYKLLGEAWNLKQSYDIAAELARVEKELGKWPEAATHWDFAMRTTPTLEQVARDRLERQLKLAITHVTVIKVICNVADARISINGEVQGQTPVDYKLYVQPGSITLSATHITHKPFTLTLEGNAAEEKSINVMLEPAAGVASDRDPPPLWPAVVLAGIGGAGLVVGGVLFGVASSGRALASDESASIVAAGGACEPAVGGFADRCAALRDDVSGVGSQQTGAGVGLAVGVAGLAGAGAYLIYALTADDSGGSSDSAVQVSPLFGDNNGLMLHGRF